MTSTSPASAPDPAAKCQAGMASGPGQGPLGSRFGARRGRLGLWRQPGLPATFPWRTTSHWDRRLILGGCSGTHSLSPAPRPAPPLPASGQPPAERLRAPRSSASMEPWGLLQEQRPRDHGDLRRGCPRSRCVLLTDRREGRASPRLLPAAQRAKASLRRPASPPSRRPALSPGSLPQWPALRGHPEKSS